MTIASTAATPPAGRPYLMAVPDSLPPFDDDRTALRRLRTLLPVRPPSPPRPVRATAVRVDSVPGWSREGDVGVRITRSGDLPPADRAAGVLARALVEVLSHQRPLAQLRSHCAPDVFAGLERYPSAASTPTAVRTVRVCEPADGVAEVAVVARTGQRAWALAFRLEGVDGRWRITAVETG